jgi:threonine dehydratase
VAPYDDPYTIAGQGTIGDEILRQIGNPDDLEAIFVAIGGGGLIAGIGAYVRALAPHVKLIGVEPAGANAMAMSLAKGARVTLSKVDGFADGVAVKQVRGSGSAFLVVVVGSRGARRGEEGKVQLRHLA